MSSRVAGPTGWAVFAGTVLAILGCINIIYGLAAIFRDEVLTTAGGHAIVWDLTAWGWIMLIFGVIQLLAAAGLFAAAEWARWVAITMAGLNAIANAGSVTVNPFFTLLIIALDIIVIYQLTARWVPAGDVDYRSYEGSDVGPTSARDQMTRARTGL